MTYYIMMNTDERLQKDTYEAIEDFETLEDAAWFIRKYRENDNRMDEVLEDEGVCFEDYYIADLDLYGKVLRRWYVDSEGYIID